MELRTLEYFVAVAEERSFTRAATRCHVAQPAISQQIRSLERELGEKLFDRGTRAVSLSAAGEALIPHARAALAAAAAAKAEFAARSGLLTGELALGTVDGVETTELPSQLGAFHRRHPGVTVRLIGGTSSDLLNRVRHGTLDAAVVALPRGGVAPYFHHRVLLQDEIVAVVSRDRPEAGKPQLTLSQITGAPLITYGQDSGLRPHLEAAFEDAGVSFRPAYATNDVALQVALVASGVGIALAAGADSTLARDARVGTVPLSPRIPYTKALIWRAESALAAPVRALLALGRSQG
ncbi:LysR family transcriptional regulator [Kitasatospora sp. GP82]|uniref:LysR family transcriptional regulator n=1 Tax=Kitasatospora sp. GP82 TaxID=3035089 RepID=UPI00247593C2|nr:LysR family transcriptional regulator [Kitasatospora sp. GP82]MDH6124064.1 DNA-binding transcriptional LysR family regulator [Kitasatospora sp. GP82]